VREQALAICFIHRTNAMHKAYLTHLQNGFLDGSDYYPSTLIEAYNILQPREPEGGLTAIEANGLAFVNASGKPREAGGQNLDHIVCFECGNSRH
jgi:hypothetical protein